MYLYLYVSVSFPGFKISISLNSLRTERILCSGILTGTSPSLQSINRLVPLKSLSVEKQGFKDVVLKELNRSV